MAVKLIDATVKMGRVIPVQNTKIRYSGEKESYDCVKVEDEDGGNERYLLFTRCELINITKQQTYGLDNAKAGRIHKQEIWDPIARRKRIAYVCKFLTYTNDPRMPWKSTFVRIPLSWMKRAEQRAQRNPEDIAFTNLWQNLLD